MKDGNRYLENAKPHRSGNPMTVSRVSKPHEASNPMIVPWLDTIPAWRSLRKSRQAGIVGFCGARTRQGGTCRKPAGWGTDHPGVGRCRLHGGATPTGVRSPHFKHGLRCTYLPLPVPDSDRVKRVSRAPSKREKSRIMAILASALAEALLRGVKHDKQPPTTGAAD